MQNNVAPIIVRKEGVNDDFYKVIELYTDHGSWVEEGDLILCFETSKTAIDIEAPTKGYVFFDANENEEISIGQTIAVIAEEETFSYNDWFRFVNKPKEIKKDTQDKTIKISKPAQKLIDQHTIDIAVFKGLSMITRADVEDYIHSLHSPSTVDDIQLDKGSVLIFGGGGHAKVCIEIIKQTKTHTMIGVVDDNIPLNTPVLDIPVIGNLLTVDQLAQKGLQNIILGIGGVLRKGMRKKIFLSLKEKGLYVPNIIHPSASVEPSVQLGEGNQIMQGAIIGSNVTVGNNCIINSGSIISHDTVIGDNVHIAPGAIIAGGVTIKEDSIIGMGATIFLGLTIGKNVVIQNGTHIFTDIEDHSHIKKDITGLDE
ncbi:NeuD/PglB/VioB family sugar acetyltransferase [uncultured Dokdonia sp.]|uniref:NeuD/PglB/VioB family sugar acetyltransferase n=1 Tax=uncultured Dokdonia sp. TaxID=575653 RepID=UPI00260A5DCF|nr:NeuD/PglB/VioB family sugar acetyltransferase [uncultured Dokdonia sp.]